jgi:hypothetical protein
MNSAHRGSRWLLLPVGVALGTTLAFGLNSLAEDSELDSEPRVFPYNGVLELDGASYSGQADFSFSLSDDAGCAFTEAHDAVQVAGGRFSVNIGAVAGGVPDCVFDAERVFLAIAVREVGDTQPHRQLTGRQRVHPVPFAYWAAEGADLRVDGLLNVEGAALIGGDATIGGGASVGGALNVEGMTTLGNQLSFSGVGAERQINALNNLNAGGGALTVGGDVTIGSTEQVRTLTVNGPIQGRTISANNGLFVTGGAVLRGSDLRLGEADIEDTNLHRVMSAADNATRLRLNVNGDFSAGVTVDGPSLNVTNDLTAASGNIQDLTVNNLTANNLGITSFHRVTAARSEDYGDIDRATLPSASTHLCVLTGMTVGDDNDEDDQTRCGLDRVNGVWILSAQTSTNERDTVCESHCFRFR